jgi:hypothetical protein
MHRLHDLQANLQANLQAKTGVDDSYCCHSLYVTFVSCRKLYEALWIALSMISSCD